MTIVDLTSYLIELERSGYTGQVTLNFHKGDASKDIDGPIMFETGEMSQVKLKLEEALSSEDA